MKTSSLRWYIRNSAIIIFYILRSASEILYRIFDWFLIKLDFEEKPKLQASKDEWKQFGRKKDGMILQKNTFTGQKRLIVESTGQVLPVQIP